MNLLVAIGGLAFLILIHEAGHFVVARAVAMRPRKFYLFFPPALAKWHRNGIEYGIGSIPLGGYVKIPGMHRPAARDADAHFASTLEEAPWVRPEFNRVRRALEGMSARLVGPDPEAIVALGESLVRGGADYDAMATRRNVYGDGRAAARIVDFLERELGAAVPARAPA